MCPSARESDAARRVLLVDPGVYHMHAITLLEPLGICCVGAYLRQHGFEVRLLQVRNSDPGALIDAVRSFEPGIVGFSCYTSNFRLGRELARRVRAISDCSIVFGGIHATLNPEIAQQDFVDFVVQGEGERTMLALAQALVRGEHFPEHVRGLCYARGSELVDTGISARIVDLDALPLPMRDGLPMHLYRSAVPKPPFSEQRGACISASRGCHFDCLFCTTKYVMGQRRMSRSVHHVMEEIECLKAQHGVNALYFGDEDLAFDRAWLHELCRALVDRQLDMSWYCFARVTSLDRPLVAAMAEAGCTSIGFGLESPDPSSLKQIDKQISQEQIARALAWVDEHGIYSIGFIMIGLPWHTRANIEEGLRFLHQTKLDLVYPSFATPFPKTRLYQQAHEEGLVQVHDTDAYSHLEPVMATRHLSRDELRRISKRYTRHFYLRPRYLARQARRLARDPVPLLSVAQAMRWRLREHVRGPNLFSIGSR